MQARFIRNLLVLCVSVAVSYTAHAQNASRIYIEPNGWSIGTNFGFSDLFGDVGTQSAMTHYSNKEYTKRMAFMGGMFGRYTIHPALAVRLAINYGSLFATDKWNKDLAFAATTQGDDAFQRYARNQNARDFIFEPSVMMEITPMRINPEAKIAHKRGQPYIGAGLAYFHYTPYSTVGYGLNWVKSAPLHVEGQGFGDGFPEEESLWQLAIPLAIGYRIDIGQHINLGVEFNYRMTFTDYLDGVSGKYISRQEYLRRMDPKDAAEAYNMADKSYFTGLSTPQAPGNLRGNPSNNDSYSTFSINLYYKISTRTKEWWHE